MPSVEVQQASAINTEEQVSQKLLAFFLIFGTLGAIVMSWISYAALVH